MGRVWSKAKPPCRLTLCAIIHAVNRFHSGSDTDYLPRWITPHLQRASQEHRVVVLNGARQVGKSTLLRRAEPFASWRYYTLDDYDVLRQAEQDPKALWAGDTNVVLDEVQKVPTLLPAIKHTVGAE